MKPSDIRHYSPSGRRYVQAPAICATFPYGKLSIKARPILAIGLGRRLCENGYPVRFTQAASLATELSEATEDKVLGRLMKALESVDLLIVDELSYVSFTKSQSELSFHALSARNEKGSVMITTNLEFSKWTELFPDPMLAAAMIDRITHRSHILDMNGASYRLAETKRRQSKGGGSVLHEHGWLTFGEHAAQFYMDIRTMSNSEETLLDR